MKRGRSSYFARLGARPRAPQQLEIGGTCTHPAVEQAHRRQLKKAEQSKSWEDDFLFHVKANRLPLITRKFLFAKQRIGRKWEADFAYPEHMLLIEIDGGVWRRGGGAHSHPTNILRDMEKQNDATLLGYSVLRFTSDQVKNGEAIGFLIRVLHERGWRRQ